MKTYRSLTWKRSFTKSMGKVAAALLPVLLPTLASAQGTSSFHANPSDSLPVASLAAKCDPTLISRFSQQGKRPTGWTSVIVQLDGELTGDRRRVLQALQSDIYRNLPLIRAIAVRLPVRNFTRLAALPFVAHISPDSEVRKADEFTVWHSNADYAWYNFGVSGSGIGVAVVDSGISTHQDLRAGSVRTRIVANVNYAADAGTSDQCGHGTHVAGIVGGNGAKSSTFDSYRTFYGIAPSANLINVRVLDKQGSGTTSSVISGINWVVANRSRFNIRVMNLSLGKPVTESYKTDPLCQAVEAAYRAGITVVCAAGNNGRANTTWQQNASNGGWGAAYGSIQSPGNDPYVITVGAVKQDLSNPYDRSFDTVATYSSRGPSRVDYIMKPDILAPGNQVISLNVNGSYLNNSFSLTNSVALWDYLWTGSSQPSSDYFYLSGTSMAAPVVSGAAALLLHRDPTLTPDAIKARLMITADKWSGPDGTNDPCTYGAGLLNIYSAMFSTARPTLPALSPPLVLSPDNKNILVDPQQVIWGGGDGKTPVGTVWGTDGVSSLQVIWGGGAKPGNPMLPISPTNANLLANPAALTNSPIWSNQVIWGGGDVKVDLSFTTLFGEW